MRQIKILEEEFLEAEKHVRNVNKEIRKQIRWDASKEKNKIFSLHTRMCLRNDTQFLYDVETQHYTYIYSYNKLMIELRRYAIHYSLIIFNEYKQVVQYFSIIRPQNS